MTKAFPRNSFFPLRTKFARPAISAPSVILAPDEARGDTLPGGIPLRFREFRQYIPMAALWSAPTPQRLPFQLGFRCRQQRLIAENIRAVFLDDLLAIAVAADHEGIAPFRGPANIDVERCAFAVHDFCGSSACHKRLLIVLLDGVLGAQGVKAGAAAECH